MSASPSASSNSKPLAQHAYAARIGPPGRAEDPGIPIDHIATSGYPAVDILATVEPRFATVIEVRFMEGIGPAVQSFEHPLFSTPVHTYGSVRSLSVQDYVRRALNIFHDHGLVAPEDDHLELIARFALEAQQRFFTAALYDPDEAQLNHFFEAFVLFCARPLQVL
jgi:hypothetical protein